MPLGYDVRERKLEINAAEAGLVEHIHRRYLALGCVAKLKTELDRDGACSKRRISARGIVSGGKSFTRGALYRILQNRIYRGEIVHKGTAYPGQHQSIIDAELWRQVQNTLAANRIGRANGVHASNPSLLAGLLFDDQGNTLSPSHAVKNGRRYRYYVNQALTQYRFSDAGAIRRVAAHEIESLVCRRLLGFLGDQPHLIDSTFQDSVCNQLQTQVIAEATKIIDNWNQMASTEKRSLIRTVIQRIEFGTDRVAIAVSISGLRDLLGINDSSRPEAAENTITLIEDAQIKTLGGETRLILNGKPTDTPANQSDSVLISALARAHAWHREFMANPELPLKHYADQANRTERHVTRMMHLAYLAPDITQAILNGSHPRHLSLTKLLSGIPTSWQAQRTKFGF